MPASAYPRLLIRRRSTKRARRPAVSFECRSAPGQERREARRTWPSASSSFACLRGARRDDRLSARLLRGSGHCLPGRLGSRRDGALAAHPVRSKPPPQPGPVVGEAARSTRSSSCDDAGVCLAGTRALACGAARRRVCGRRQRTGSSPSLVPVFHEQASPSETVATALDGATRGRTQSSEHAGLEVRLMS